MFRFLVNRFLNDNMQLVLSTPFIQALTATLLARTKNNEVANLLRQLLAVVAGETRLDNPFAVVALPNHPDTKDFTLAIIPEQTLVSLKSDLQGYIDEQQAKHQIIPPHLFAFNERVATRLAERDFYRTNIRRRPA